jgi:AmpD protein
MYLDNNTGLISAMEYIPSQNNDKRPDPSDIDTLVIHAISLPPDQFGGDYIQQLFTNCLDPEQHPYFAKISHLQVSAHFLVRRDGQMIQFVPTTERAWHAGDSCFQGRTAVNDYSVGIELEGSDEKQFANAQYNQLAWLTRIIMDTYPAITLDRIVGHCDISPGRKTDPGPCFDWLRYKNLVEH